MGGRRVRVFHISDLHMRSAEGPQGERARLEAASRWRVLGEKWTANLAELCGDSTPVDLVAFTGDLGDWGHPTDYPRALAFLRDTCAALDVPLDRLFVIPGNHDIDRKERALAWRWMRNHIEKDPSAYSEWMAGLELPELRRNRHRDQILARQRAFWTAVATDLGRPELEPRHSPHGRLGYRQEVTLPGLSQPLHVIGLDTAWLAGDEHDSGKLRLTEHQVLLLTNTESGAPLPGFRLALMHHRLADLADAVSVHRLMADRVDLLLHGHQHEPAADVLQGPDHQLLVLATGCLYEGNEGHGYPNTCQVIDLALDEQARPLGAEVRFRGWSSRGLFWGDDALLYQSARGGRLRLGRGERGWNFGAGTGEQREPDATTKLEEFSERSPKPLFLKFIAGKYMGAEVRLPPSGLVQIGRASGLEVELKDDSVSRIHARILISRGAVTISDNGSTNGTFVNGERVDHAARLNVGDRILIGMHIMRLTYDAGSGPKLKKVRQQIETNAKTEGMAPRKKDSRMFGNLEDVPIEDLLRMLLITERSGILGVKSNSKFGQITLVQGEVISASVGGNPLLPKREAFIEIFTWRTGTFEFTSSAGVNAISDLNTIKGSTEQLLSEGLQILRRGQGTAGS